MQAKIIFYLCILYVLYGYGIFLGNVLSLRNSVATFLITMGIVNIFIIFYERKREKTKKEDFAYSMMKKEIEKNSHKK